MSTDSTEFATEVAKGDELPGYWYVLASLFRSETEDDDIALATLIERWYRAEAECAGYKAALEQITAGPAYPPTMKWWNIAKNTLEAARRAARRQDPEVG